MNEIIQYTSIDGFTPFEKWFSSLGTQAALKIRTAIAQMELGNFGDHQSVGNGVWERRIHFQKGYRVYYAIAGKQVVLLLAGGTKAKQQRDINRAKAYLSDFKRRRKQSNQS